MGFLQDLSTRQGICLFWFPVFVATAPYCAEDEFQCHRKQDGCIPLEKSCDGWIDCMRDGSDESEEECHSGQGYAKETDRR